MATHADLRGYLGRILGWADEARIAQAQEAIELAAAHKTQLILCGAGDLVPVAFGLHRYAFGATPFVVCDPRRSDVRASVRSPANYRDVESAFEAARGGSLCVRRHRLPSGMAQLGHRLRATHEIQYILLESVATEWLVRPGPIEIPALATRVDEVPRIVEEFLHDVDVELALAHPLDASAIAWLAGEALRGSIGELAKTTRRLLVLRNSATLTEAAKRLKMAPVSLSRWMGRRALPPTLTHVVMQEKAREAATCARPARATQAGDAPPRAARRRVRRAREAAARKPAWMAPRVLFGVRRRRRMRCLVRHARRLCTAARAAAATPSKLGG